MRSRTPRAAATASPILALLIAACFLPPPASGGEATEIFHTPPACAARAKELPLQVQVTEPPQVRWVNVSYRAPSWTIWEKESLARVAGDVWEGHLPARAAVEKELEYYVEAVSVTFERTRGPGPGEVYRAQFGTDVQGYCADDFLLLSCVVGLLLTVVLVAAVLVMRRTRSNR